MTFQFTWNKTQNISQLSSTWFLLLLRCDNSNLEYRAREKKDEKLFCHRTGNYFRYHLIISFRAELKKLMNEGEGRVTR